ncbi:uncharacterized protein LOC135207719 [Macrobrachium nipponense]|uniref:uncharacterized protein LOC135207719 n=1 Tax=Macrobrachium nipponense TaxID=159736 RepID=UPI0030C7D8A7
MKRSSRFGGCLDQRKNLPQLIILTKVFLLAVTVLAGTTLTSLLFTFMSPLEEDWNSTNSMMHGAGFSVALTDRESAQSFGSKKKRANNSQERSILSSKGYTIPGCPCVRFGFSVESLQKAQRAMKRDGANFSKAFVERYSFEGQSTCSDYTTQRGARQNVVSYSFYSTEGKVDPGSQHFKKYLSQLHGRAGTIREKYKGWTMRIYHNISTDDEHGLHFLCRIFCVHQHVDICHVSDLPMIGNLEKMNKVGRLWRFAVMGDPTVSKFLIRDTDSWILDREVDVVKEWLSSGKSFHTIHDHPGHKAIMLAGLWGGTNKDSSLMERLRNDMFHQPLNLSKTFDQYLLANYVWPHIKSDVMQHSSYNCQQEGLTNSLPFPTQRIDGLYCGWGPFKFKERKRVFMTKCPEQCRPKAHKKWVYC